MLGHSVEVMGQFGQEVVSGQTVNEIVVEQSGQGVCSEQEEDGVVLVVWDVIEECGSPDVDCVNWLVSDGVVDGGHGFGSGQTVVEEVELQGGHTVSEEEGGC